MQLTIGPHVNRVLTRCDRWALIAAVSAPEPSQFVRRRQVSNADVRARKVLQRCNDTESAVVHEKLKTFSIYRHQVRNTSASINAVLRTFIKSASAVRAPLRPARKTAVRRSLQECTGIATP